MHQHNPWSSELMDLPEISRVLAAPAKLLSRALVTKTSIRRSCQPEMGKACGGILQLLTQYESWRSCSRKTRAALHSPSPSSPRPKSTKHLQVALNIPEIREHTDRSSIHCYVCLRVNE
jgi:hypothetical protein